MATCGQSAGAAEVKDEFASRLKETGLKADLLEVGCIGMCYAEPIVMVKTPGQELVCYGNVQPGDVNDIIESHIRNNIIIDSLALGVIGESDNLKIPSLFSTQVMKGQVRRVLANCGLIDPENIGHYLAKDGYSGLRKALQMEPSGIIDIIRKSGLRGRGGAGFPTWKKWTFCYEQEADRKYLICNADEGDPGAFMNRSLLEGDPHSLIEGMIIAGYAIGANEAYIYCRAEYPLALERLRLAISQAEEKGFLGKRILNSNFSFNIKIKEGAGAFVCGEETALIASIEGKRGMPVPRPPYPAVSGLWGKPTVINNVETLASVAIILRNGHEWYSEIGTENSKGSKTFALVGKVNHTGLIEVPLGTTIREMVFETGGGIPGNRKFKAVQTGGPSGGCIPESLIDVPVDYDELAKVGTIMGSGGIVVMDESTCMVDFAKYFLEFANKESCGKCAPCRLGTRQMLDILDDIVKGKGKLEDIDLLLELAEGVKKGSLCGLGQTAPNPVITTIKYFRHEYEEHILQKRCRASVCTELVSSPCQHTCPIGTEVPAYITYIARKEFKKAYEIILKDNPLMSVCGRVCHHPCEEFCQTGNWGDPIAIRALKRFATDWAIEQGLYPTQEKFEIFRESVGIIGAGPGGLMAGYNLVKKGYDVTIYEAELIPGGALATAIPEYRLPLDILNLDIRNIMTAGVKINTNTRVGKDIFFDALREKHDALLIATGAHKSKNLGIENESADGITDALSFLKKVKMKEDTRIGEVVGVIGGGNAAIDAARSAVRLQGCKKVIIIYRRTETEIPAFPEEIEAGLEEGVEIMYLTTPVKVLTDKDNKVRGLTCIKMTPGEYDSSGRRRPVPVEGSEFDLQLSSVIVAIGEDPGLDFINGNQNLEINKNNSIKTDPESFATSIHGVFAVGDAVTGPDTIIKAMGGGKVAAEMIDKFLRGENVKPEYAPTRPSVYVKPLELDPEIIAELYRPAVPRIGVSERSSNFSEVDKVLDEKTAIKESYRCLRCDLETEDAIAALNNIGL
ncbi:MAG: NADH-quinone oxidoreductase subunit NuoF [Deltaproteobacteria bacterium]|nr:NADH-quinone oxidoreductase subunit NuoF [Deltaproteobacteria bacterium]HDZ41601.1 NADH-quinone oxidoreductase subunit NuoF [Bacteroidota bacterium]